MIRSISKSLSRIADRMLTVGNHDFCPWANRYVYWLKQPIGWFVLAALAAASIGLFAVPQGWFVCGVILLVTVLGVAWPWLAMRGLSAEVAFARRRCHEHDSVPVTLVVTNRWPWPVWGLLVERGFFEKLANDEQDQTATTALASVPGWSKTVFTFEFLPPRRGAYPLQAPILATGFPFGLWLAHRRIAIDDELIAWPRCVDLKSLPLLQGERLSAVGAFVDRAGNDGDILSARHFREGDSLRRIHWAHTARRDTLIVCERQSASRRTIVVTLDPAAFSDDNVADRDLLDCGLRVVASLCREFHGHACELSCELNGDRRAVAPTSGGLHQLFDHLARFEPESGVSPNGEPVNRLEQLTLFITTVEGWERLCMDWGAAEGRSFHVIVLDPGTVPQNGAPSARPWMWFDVSGDMSRQLQLQWERQCHDDWSVN